MSDFLTIEDVNGTLYRNQGFYWHEIDISKITTYVNEEFTNVKYDCFEITREHTSSINYYTVKVQSSLWAKTASGLYIGGSGGVLPTLITGGFTIYEDITHAHTNFKIYVYMGLF